MTKPSDKSPEIENFLEANFGRSTAINQNKCLKPPIGCGGPATEFRNEISAREYTISGLCQNCQDSVFGAD
jgi:hypothetical protein